MEASAGRDLGVHSYYQGKIDEMELVVRDRTQNLERLKAQRNELNAKVRMLREELHHLQESGSYVGEVVKAMGKKKVRRRAAFCPLPPRLLSPSARVYARKHRCVICYFCCRGVSS